MNNRWIPMEDEVLRKHYGLVKIESLELLLPAHPRGSIYKRAQKLNLKGNPSLAARRYEVDRTFFSSESLLSCYWAGFIAADGNIGKGNSVRITLARKDRNHLEVFKNDVGYSGPIKDRVSRPTNKRPTRPVKPYSCVVIWGVAEWVDVLYRRYNITPRKSLTLQPPTSLRLWDALAFITGYIDGDGSIHWSPNHGGKIFRLKIVGTRRVLRWIYNTFKNLIPRQQWRKVKIGLTNNYPSLTFGGQRAIRICQILNGIPQLPRLHRKWSRVPSTGYVAPGVTCVDAWTA